MSDTIPQSVSNGCRKYVKSRIIINTFNTFNNVKYSFIIPVFNRPDEVDELLDSLTRQTVTDFEVVVVEDGSQVPCEDICRKYAARLDIHYYMKPNSGPGQSRNYGVERAKGEYVLILDSDVVVPENYLRAARKRGADGFYVSSQGGDGNSLPEKIWKEQVRQWDKHVSEVANEIGEINILHICDYGTPFKNAEALYAFADYPASIINVPLNFSDGSTLNLKEAQKRFGRPIFGGLERLGVIANGSIEEAKAAVDKVLENASPNFILGADCTVPGTTDWDKLRAVIDYAHNWRKTHQTGK